MTPTEATLLAIASGLNGPGDSMPPQTSARPTPQVSAQTPPQGSEHTSAQATPPSPQQTLVPLGARTYANPLMYEDGKVHTAPDPFVIRYRDLYYCYATDEHGILVSTSPDMVQWTSRGFCYTEAGRRNFWAPSVILINGVFHMYFSNMPEAENDTHTEIMRVAVSAGPLGPFTKQAELFGTFAIDSQVVFGDDGRLYLLYADNQATGLSDERPGTSVMIDRLVTPCKREGKPRALIVPTMDEEIFARNRFGDGRDWHTVEGATYFTYRDKAFITYSANAYEHEDYFVGYSHAPLPANPTDAHVDQLDWVKQINHGRFDPLLIRSRRVEGTGHNSIVRAPNGIDDWLVYHGRNAEDELYVGTEQRVMRIDPLYYAEGGLDTPGPTGDAQDAPLAGTVHDDFAHGMGPDWTQVFGSARSDADANGHILVADDAGTFFAVAGAPSATQVISVWAKATVTPLGARFGIVARYENDCNLSVVEIDAGRSAISVIDIIGGIASTRASTDVAESYSGFAGLDFHEWHEYRIERRYCHLEVRVDGRFVASCTISDTPGRVGLFSLRTAAAFSAYAATEHVNLWGAGLRDFGREMNAAERLVIDDGRSVKSGSAASGSMDCGSMDCGSARDSSMDGVRPFGVRPATFELASPLCANRFVLDFAMHTDRGQSLIAMGEYRMCITASDVELMHGGEAIAATPQPVRLRSSDDSVRRDRLGRAVSTVRIEATEDAMRLHVRGRSWRVPLAGSASAIRARITLDCASLTGYTRTSLKTYAIDRSTAERSTADI
jgi:GH43 family beta-xylosidase